MPTPVKMPRLGESVAEGTVGAWLKKEGDYVEKDESLAEIITDKINAELPSPIAGRIAKILVQTDETVAVGVDIALIEESADVATEAATPQAAPVKSAAQATTPVLEQKTAAALPREDGARSAGRSKAGSAPLSLPLPANNDRRSEATTTSAGNGARNGHGEEERQRISPLARRLAREHSLDLNEIVGTGIGGRVRKEDILAYLAQEQSAPEAIPQYATPAVFASQPSAPSSPVAPPHPSVGPTQVTVAGSDEEVVVPSRMRLAIAEHMVRSKRTSPHATAMVEVDMTSIAKWLEKNKDEFKRREGYSISYVPFVMKAVCEGLRKFPMLNSSWTEDNKIIVRKRINLGVAVATDAGLVVPTVYDADQYTIAGLAKQVNALAQRARANKLTIQDLQNSTFVVNNTGVFGTIISIPIINQPNAGILAMNAVVKRPVVTEDDAIAIRSMMYLCLSFDHRILDGAGSGGFLQTVTNKLQSYGREIDVY
ncbi:MAG TPA: dihydrolipoamide acetyltransferase family protein [Ktedonosporobacter sp.]|nr:dihydrolipoamide acetyltransferase family protein [Ktedonosporobacter sp.]